MKLRYLLILCLLLPACSDADAWGPMLMGGGTPVAGEPNTTMGVTDESGATEVASDSRNRCVEFTAPSSFTATYGYFYGSRATGAATTFTMSVHGDNGGSPSYPNTGDQIGGCSSSGTLPAQGAEAWNEVTFSPGLSLTNGAVYWICSFTAETPRIWYFAATNEATYQDDAACSITAAGTLTTYKAIQFVANYQAK